MGLIGEFAHEPDFAFTCGGKVIIQTDRGIEIGQQVSFTCYGCDRSVTRDQIRSYVKESGADCYRFNNGRILREANHGDLAEMRHLDLEIKEKIEVCRKCTEELALPMKIVDAEHVFGGERVIFYFMAEDRIDFRELVHLLAREFQTRIEMRQVGARDEARLLADYETCGRECCCKNFLKNLKPVGMQMAKLQKATLDPSKVSGRCGRLKCCLRYEHESYAELNKKLPRVGKRVRTASDEGVIIDRQILTQLLKIRKDEGTVITIRLEDVTDRDVPPPPPPPPGAEPAERLGNGRQDRRRPRDGEPAGRGGPPRARTPRDEPPRTRSSERPSLEVVKTRNEAVPVDDMPEAHFDDEVEADLLEADPAERETLSSESDGNDGCASGEAGQAGPPSPSQSPQAQARRRGRRRRRDGNSPPRPNSPPPAAG
jgi:cell fate regulator YaaT (PSP1 superfamily)